MVALVCFNFQKIGLVPSVHIGFARQMQQKVFSAQDLLMMVWNE